MNPIRLANQSTVDLLIIFLLPWMCFAISEHTGPALVFSALGVLGILRGLITPGMLNEWDLLLIGPSRKKAVTLRVLVALVEAVFAGVAVYYLYILANGIETDRLRFYSISVCIGLATTRISRIISARFFLPT